MEAKSPVSNVSRMSTEPSIEEQELPMSEWLSDSSIGFPNHFFCVVCKEAFPSKHALDEHQSVHAKEKEEANELHTHDSMTPNCSEERKVKRVRLCGSHPNYDDDVKGKKIASTADVERASNKIGNVIVIEIDDDVGNEAGLDLKLKL